jgi:hypothetical protein
MKATVAGLAALLALAVFAPASRAQYCRPFYPCCYAPIPRAPDASGQGSYCANGYGQMYGPNYNVYPPFQPFNGMVFPPCNGNGYGNGYGNGGSPLIPTHPFARGPRDYFMVDVPTRTGCW